MIRMIDIRAALDRHDRIAVVMIAAARGSTPRETGAAMLVTPDGATGTIGGGSAEHRALQTAWCILSGGEVTGHMLELPLGPDLDQCCGGHMQVAVAPISKACMETHDASTRPDASNAQQHCLPLWPGGPVFRDPPPGWPVLVYGAGHVGHALVQALAPLPFQITWVDARPGLMDNAPAGVVTLETPLPEHAATAAPDDAMHVILTHSHALDLEIAATVLARPHMFCGLIGSTTKKALFCRRLTTRGVDPARLICPIGLAGRSDKRPAVIAALVASQLLEVQAATTTILDHAGQP